MIFEIKYRYSCRETECSTSGNPYKTLMLVKFTEREKSLSKDEDERTKKMKKHRKKLIYYPDYRFYKF